MFGVRGGGVGVRADDADGHLQREEGLADDQRGDDADQHGELAKVEEHGETPVRDPGELGGGVGQAAHDARGRMREFLSVGHGGGRVGARRYAGVPQRFRSTIGRPEAFFVKNPRGSRVLVKILPGILPTRFTRFRSTICRSDPKQFLQDKPYGKRRASWTREVDGS